MDGTELLKLADYATAHMTVLKTLTINLVRAIPPQLRRPLLLTLPADTLGRLTLTETRARDA